LNKPRVFVYYIPLRKKTKNPQEGNKYINFLALRRTLPAPLVGNHRCSLKTVVGIGFAM